jgi:membrane-bound lytic murein transglycosylase A
MGLWHFLKISCLAFFCLFFICQNASADRPKMILTEVTYRELPGWNADNFKDALAVFLQSCPEIMTRHNEITGDGLALRPIHKWREVCLKAEKMGTQNERGARHFFENNFSPYAVSMDNNHENQGNVGLFTGYYLPLLHASMTPTKQFSIPIYALPNDLVKGGPYSDRKTINREKLDGHAKILMWTDDPIDLYFAHVQGSALVQLPDGKRMVIGYAGNNGRKYTSIGKILVDHHGLPKSDVSMQSIRAWLVLHPKQMDSIFNQNESYVFFKILADHQVLGTEKVPLTPERSLAIDNSYIPFGAPLWLTTKVPDKTYHLDGAIKNLRRLVIAQDTGGAIKGVLRGDIYWGAGEKAAYIAGHMNSPGQYWLLLPK